MYSKILPSHNKSPKNEKKDEVINADDPSNKNRVSQILSEE